MKESARPRGTDSVRIMPVIETKGLVGRGTEEDPCREIRQYWSLEGKLLAEDDDFIENEKRSAMVTIP